MGYGYGGYGGGYGYGGSGYGGRYSLNGGGPDWGGRTRYFGFDGYRGRGYGYGGYGGGYGMGMQGYGGYPYRYGRYNNYYGGMGGYGGQRMLGGYRGYMSGGYGMGMNYGPYRRSYSLGRYENYGSAFQRGIWGNRYSPFGSYIY